MHRTRVKVCGITCVEDALIAADAGADALGFVFYPPSPRAVSPEAAAEIVAQLPPIVTCVGLFVDAERDGIMKIAERCHLDLLQLHGKETPAFCQSLGRPYIKALRMRDDADVAAVAASYPAARGLLLDSYKPGVPGGTGETFDWLRIPPQLAAQTVLAGGLRPDNVARAIAQVKPYGVDVSGGVEARPGRKNAEAVRQFIRAVAQADQSYPGSLEVEK